MSIRKASIVALGIFGSLTGVESQAYRVVNSRGISCFSLGSISLRPANGPERHPHALDTSSLVIIWGTLWSGRCSTAAIWIYWARRFCWSRSCWSTFCSLRQDLPARALNQQESGLVDRMSNISACQEDVWKIASSGASRGRDNCTRHIYDWSKRKYKRKPRAMRIAHGSGERGESDERDLTPRGGDGGVD